MLHNRRPSFLGWPAAVLMPGDPRWAWGLALIGLLAMSAVASAQTPGVVSYEVRVYTGGSPTPYKTETFAASAAVCNQAPPVNPTTVNPTRIVFDDATTAGQVCIYVEPAVGVLMTLPTGAYLATLAAVDAAGNQSAESNQAAFTRNAAPPVPTHVAVIK